jgi:two-component system sensor histidine kinase KdpD
MALAYLLVVLFASAREGRFVGLLMATLCFFLFNFFLLPPLYTFDVADPLEWWVLASFLITGTVAAELLYRAQRARALAEERAREIERLGEEARHVDALREADRLKDAMLANVSHDLRTPLTAIRATAAAMRSEGHEDAAIIEEEAERLNRFVTDLLDISRIRAGALPVEPALNAADDLVGAALDDLRAFPGTANIRVIFPADMPIPVGRFDFVNALRALVNLLENALHHSPSDEPVVLEIRRRGAMLLFHVRDRGPGIDPAEKERLFEPFQRGRTANGRPGMGLGLAIARGAARAMGGDVDWRPSDGGGSEFTLRLPAADVPGLS